MSVVGGALDIDDYDIKVQTKVFLVRKAKDLKLLELKVNQEDYIFTALPKTMFRLNR